MTKYYCDECENEVESEDSFYRVGIGIHKGNDRLVHNYMAVCLECIEGVGFEITKSEYYRSEKLSDRNAKFSLWGKWFNRKK